MFYVSGSSSRQVPLGLKTTNHRDGATITYWGSNTGGWVNNTVYTVSTCDVIVNSTGGSGLYFTLIDPQDNVKTTGLTSLDREYIPLGYKLNVTYATATTLWFWFKG